MAENVPAQITDMVRERIKLMLGDMIPDETWKKIVQETTGAFIYKDLPELVRAELRAYFTEQLRAEFAKPEWQSKWVVGMHPQASELVRKIMTENAHEILASLMSTMAQNVVLQIQQQAQVRTY